MFTQLLRRTAILFRHRQFGRDLEEEMQHHVALKAEAHKREGVSHEEARNAALREFGNTLLLREKSRDRWGFGWLETLLLDARHAVRMLCKSPGFTTVAILTLALGIGANTAIFSLLDGLVLRDLPVPHPEQLITFGAPNVSLPMFQEITHDQRVFSGTFAWWGGALMNVQTDGEFSRAMVEPVNGDFYSELGAAPEIGRLLDPSDADLSAGVPSQVAVLSYDFWRHKYGFDRTVLGKTLKIEGLPFTIIGVERKGFIGMDADTAGDIIVPLTAEPLINGFADVQNHLQRRDVLWLNAAGRLKPGVTIDQARAQLNSLWPEIREAVMPLQLTAAQRAYFLSLKLMVMSVATGRSSIRVQFTKPVFVLLAVSGVVLLLACVNLASLLLSRAATRTHEFAVRVALGAKRSRLARQMLTESILLSVAGAVAGFALAEWGGHALARFILAQYYQIPASIDLSPDWRILSFTAAMAILTGAFFGLAPAWYATRDDPNSALQRSSRGIGCGTAKLSKGLTVTQVALSLVLLAGAGLFIRTLEKLRSVQPGFQIEGVTEVDLFPEPNAFKNADRVSYFHELTDRVSHLPGVISAGTEHREVGNFFEWIERMRASNQDQQFTTDCEMVMPGFFRTESIPLLQGRSFRWSDGPKAPLVALISEELARRAFPHGAAIGQHIDIATEPKWKNIEIVGVVGNVSLYDIRKSPQPTVFLPTLQYGDYADDDELLVRTNVPLASMIPAVRSVLESLGSESVYSANQLSQTVDRSILPERITAMLSAFFGMLSLSLAAIGLYGLMAYNVTRRTRELGIRVALGAQRSAVMRMILGETLTLTLIGVLIGLLCALAATRLTAHMLFGVTPYDPVTLTGVTFALIAVGTLAGYIPARRAMKVDPMVALRDQ